MRVSVSVKKSVPSILEQNLHDEKQMKSNTRQEYEAIPVTSIFSVFLLQFHIVSHADLLDIFLEGWVEIFFARS